MKRLIVRTPNEVLTKPAKAVVSFDKKLHRLIADMTDTLLSTTNPKGVGLAAPQIGEPYRVFLTKPTAASKVHAFINPEILSSSGTTDTEEENGKLEGCLSIPGIWGKVKRAHRLTLRYQDEHGETKSEEFSGFHAIVIQHETDHVNGTLYTHRVLEQKGKLYQTTTDKEGKEVLEELRLA